MRAWQRHLTAARYAGGGRLTVPGVLVVTAALLYGLGLCLLFWWPWNFHTDEFSVQRLLVGILHVPFASLYTGSEYNALNQVAGKMLLFAPWGAMIMLGVCRHRRTSSGRGLATVVAVAAAVGVVIESGQVLLPGRAGDVTDVILYAAGAVTGAMLVRGLNQRHAGRGG